MKFSASQSSLLSGLQPLAAVVPTKSPMPVLTHFLTQLSGNILTVSATDLEVSMETKIEVKGLKDGRALLPARKFMEEIRVFPDEMLTIDAAESGRIKLEENDRVYNLSAESVQNYPKVPELDEASSLTMEARKLKRLISKTLFAVSRDELRPQLTGLYMKATAEEIRMVSTDGHRLVKMTVKHGGYSGKDYECIVPSKAVSTVARMTDREGDVQILFGTNQLAFRIGNTTLITKLIEGRYPNYEAVIPSENKNTLTVDLDQFNSAVLRASIVSNEISRQIRLRITSDKMQILVEDIEQGNEGQENLPCTYTGEAMDIGYNAGYVLDVLKQIETHVVVFELGTSTSAGIVKPTEQEENEDLLMLIMPVRLN